MMARPLLIISLQEFLHTPAMYAVATEVGQSVPQASGSTCGSLCVDMQRSIQPGEHLVIEEQQRS